MSNTNNNLQTQTSNALPNAIMEAGGKDRPPMLATGNYVHWKSRIKRYIDTKPNNELIHYCLHNPPYKFKWTEKTILVAEDNDIYSTVDACPNACEMWKAVERLKQGESINVQDLETNLYWEFGKFTSWDGESLESYYSRFYKMMNELVRNKYDATNHQVQFLLQLQPEWQRFVTLVKQTQELKTVSYHKLYDILKQHQNEVNELRVERLACTANPLALVAQQQPAYHPQNHPTHYTHNSSTRSQQAATRNKGKAIVNSSTPTYDQEPVMKIYKPTNNNLKTSSNTSRANHDNTLRINRGIGYDNQRTINVAGARENVDVANNSGPIFDTEPLQNVQNDDDNYNVSANDREHPKQPESVNDTYFEEQGDTNINIDSLDMSTNGETVDQDDDDLARERDLLASLIDKLKCEIDDSKNSNNELSKTNQLMFKDLKKFQAELDRYHDVNYVSNVEIDCAKAKVSQEKDAQNTFYKTHEDKEIEKVTALENKVKVLDDIVYKTGQSVQTMNMLNRNCKTSFVRPEFLKKAQRANPRLYDIGCYNDNLALMLALESDETILLAHESRSKLNPFIQNTIEGNFCPQIRKINADLEKFHLCLKEEMVADLKYFNSLEHEVDSLKSQLETQKTKFLNKIDWLSREYYYADHMNAILGVYTTLEEFTDLQCDYVDQVFKCKRYEKELLKRADNVNNKSFNELSKIFSELEQHSINLELALHQSHKQLNNNKVWKQKESNSFRELNVKYFEIQDLKAQLQYKDIAISELKKLIEKIKGKSVETKFEKPSVIRQPNAFKHQRQSILEIILFIVDSGCSKHMTKNLKLLSNFVEKFLGTMKFRNDQIALILGYGDPVQGNVTIKKGNDLLTGSRGTNLYSITLQDTSTPNPICLMAKASSSQAWLWHHRLSHLNFDTINLLLKYDIVTGLPKLKFIKDHLFVSKSSAVIAADAPNQRQQQNTTPSTSTIVAADTSSLNIHTTPDTTSQAPTQAPTVTSIENINQAETNKENIQVEEDEFINIFSTLVQERGETSS
ncbi:retrovirus-related pol polyprotein from transposon TNT 1-94 [Tanacetum coccineum]